MDIWSIVQTLAALAFVLGLMFLVLGLIKYLQQKGADNSLFKSLRSNEKIVILEKKRLDAKTLLVLLRKGNLEFLLLTGAGGNLLLDSSPVAEDLLQERNSGKHD